MGPTTKKSGSDVFIGVDEVASTPILGLLGEFKGALSIYYNSSLNTL